MDHVSFKKKEGKKEERQLDAVLEIIRFLHLGSKDILRDIYSVFLSVSPAAFCYSDIIKYSFEVENVTSIAFICRDNIYNTTGGNPKNTLYTGAYYCYNE